MPTVSRRRSRSQRGLAAAAATTSLLVASLAFMPAAAAIEPKKVFNQRCTACHTFGHGVKVGPDLKGVTTRRSRTWLLPFIRSSQSVIKRGDRVATELFRTFKQQRMPDWVDLSPADINAILDWFAANGPEQREPDERDATLATAADVARGRALYEGTARLASGGSACASCHAVHAGARRPGGTLGPDLTDAYLRYRDRALTLFFKQPCTPRQPELGAGRYLTPEESFALKAFLRDVSQSAPPLTAFATTRNQGGPR